MKIPKLFAIGALALTIGCGGCLDKSAYSKIGEFCGYPVEIGVKADTRYIRILEGWGTRGCKPVCLYAEDTNPDKFGFEHIRIIPKQDIITGVDYNSVKSLEKFNNQSELEKIFAYVSADRKESQRKR